MHLSGGGGIGWRITHCSECEHIWLDDEILLLAIDCKPAAADAIGKARGGVTGGERGDRLDSLTCEAVQCTGCIGRSTRQIIFSQR